MKSNLLSKGLAGLCALSASSFIFGQTIETTGTTTHTLSLEAWSRIANTDFRIAKAASDPNFYINGIEVVDSNFAIEFSSGGGGRYFDTISGTSGGYTLGTEITGEIDWGFNGLFGGFAQFNTLGAAPGTYTSVINIVGGSTDSSTDVLYSYTQTINVVSTLGLNLSSPDSAFTLNVGDSATYRHQLDNPTSDEVFLNNRYVAWSDTGSEQFSLQFVDPYPTSLAAGSNQLVDHVTFTALPNPYKTWDFTHGIIAGFNSDDQNWIEVGRGSLNPVPEPGTMIALGAGVAALARARKRRK
jgi:hypothetical protein